ncbi:MAG TPA: 4'-phosphopantetheinyl transferase superfamily protein [Kofleriaceae bacterium]|nr:4'-phosphopantetheinyl transferase superfamily protein [Kofleriaceae bacterium]
MPGAALIGNDVVDSSDSTTAAAHLRERFVARVCGPAERDRVAAAADPAALLWSLFAVKEAAFKVVSKLRPGIAFAHRRFEVSEDLRTVRYDDVVLRASVLNHGDYIHAVVLLGEADCIHAVREVNPGADSSAAARALLAASLAEELGCAPGDIAVQRTPLPGSWTGFAPPELMIRGAPAGRDISLSHDGRFVAFAAIQ